MTGIPCTERRRKAFVEKANHPDILTSSNSAFFNLLPNMQATPTPLSFFPPFKLRLQCDLFPFFSGRPSQNLVQLDDDDDYYYCPAELPARQARP